jgi:hypothetical protein
MEPEGHSPCFQEPTTGPYPEPDKCIISITGFLHLAIV